MKSIQLAEKISHDIRQRLAEVGGRVVVLIVGPPAVGKTTLCKNIVQNLGDDLAAILSDDQEIYTRDVRDRLNVSSIDREARDMRGLKLALSTLSRGREIPNRVYVRTPGAQPRVEIQGTLEPKPVLLLDGFAWSYEDFEGMWDVKYVLLPYSFSDSEALSTQRDLKERGYADVQARHKHAMCWRTYVHNAARLRGGAFRIYRASRDYDYVDESTFPEALLREFERSHLHTLPHGHDDVAKEVRSKLREGGALGNVFLMCKFRLGDPKFDALIESIRSACAVHSYDVLIANDSRHPNLWDNVRIHMLASTLGIAVFDKMDGRPPSPNVYIESGFMLGCGRKILHLVQEGVEPPVNYLGKIIKRFDGRHAASVSSSVAAEVSQWLREVSPRVGV